MQYLVTAVIVFFCRLFFSLPPPELGRLPTELSRLITLRLSAGHVSSSHVASMGLLRLKLLETDISEVHPISLPT